MISAKNVDKCKKENHAVYEDGWIFQFERPVWLLHQALYLILQYFPSRGNLVPSTYNVESSVCVCEYTYPMIV